MRRQVSTKRQRSRSSRRPLAKYFPKIKKAMKRSGSKQAILQQPTFLPSTDVQPKEKQEVSQNENIEKLDVRLFKQSIKEAEKKKMSRECEITRKKLKLYRQSSLQPAPLSPDCVKEDIIIPRVIKHREGDLDSTIVHVTKDEDILPRSK